jgi:putative transposase
VNKEHLTLSISRQSALLDISRSSVYYEPPVAPREIEIMNAIDEIFTRCPFYGHRRLKPELKENYHLDVGKKLIIRLMKEMGLQAIYPRKKLNLSLPDTSHKKFPYLLKEVPIVRTNQVWGVDITYIKLHEGFAYLTALIDWFSRYVLAWELAPTLETEFCARALETALKINTPEIHNSDQGVQFTSVDYVKILEQSGVAISMDGRGRCMDNIFTERLWRSVKYENVYLHDYRNRQEAGQGLSDYFKFYNEQRRHQSLNYLTPAQIYFAK